MYELKLGIKIVSVLKMSLSALNIRTPPEKSEKLKAYFAMSRQQSSNGRLNSYEKKHLFTTKTKHYMGRAEYEQAARASLQKWNIKSSNLHTTEVIC